MIFFRQSLVAEKLSMRIVFLLFLAILDTLIANKWSLEEVGTLVDLPPPILKLSDESIRLSVLAKRRDIRLVRLAGCKAFALSSVAQFAGESAKQSIDCKSGKYNVLVDGFLS